MPAYAFKHDMLEFKETFMASCNNKSVSSLWDEFKSAIETGINTHVPQKTISSKPSLPWMTQQIRRTIRKRDSLFQIYKLLFRLTAQPEIDNLNGF